ncbi:MAG: hypothetical protein KDK36_01865 [Leptospiraceae bacterium]|nr:hypothetical protein [Leptospiraceae bacterium]
MRFFLFTFLIFLFQFCTTTEKVDPKNKYYYVKNVIGINEDDAELNAKRKILEMGLGDMVLGQSVVEDGESKRKIINSSVKGLVIGYEQIGPTRKKPGGIHEIDAKGKVSEHAVKNALKELLKTVGNPRVLMLIDETILDKLSTPGQTIAENEIAATYKEFQFLDKAQFMRIIAKEGGKTVGVYGDSSLEDKALQAAAEMGAEILLIGKIDTRNGGEISGSEGLYSIQSTTRLKFVSVGSAQIIASDNASGTYPHISPESGAIESIKKAVKKSYGKVKDQVLTRWSEGSTIRVVFEGINYDDFIDKNVEQNIRDIRGVNSVSVKNSSNSNNLIEVEVTARMSGNMLYRKMRERRSDFGFQFTQKEARPGNLYIIVK